MLRSLVSIVFASLSLLPAQTGDVRELSVPAGQYVLINASTTAITNKINSGFRLIDLEYRGSGPNFDAVLVEDTGVYSTTGWWWYFGITATQLSTFLTANSARLIDLEPYDDGAGNLRFACVMVDNTGVNHKTWWYYYGSSDLPTLAGIASTNNARFVDIDSYDLGATTYYSAVMISNTGADQRAWWWYGNVTPTQISNHINTNNAQLYDLNARANGNWDCVMIQNPTPAAWYWWYGLTSSDVLYYLGQYGARVFHLEHYVVSGQNRWAMLTINNSNALTTSIGNAMRADTDGQVGCWMQRINGSNLADLNGDTVFEPASTMKTLHHTHAMRQVSLGLPLTTLLTVYSGYSGSCPQDTGPFTQQLQGVLQLMMQNSDNARAQAVRAYFGEANLNATAAALGMSSTSSNHRLGCGADAIANPNQITLHDLHRLHTQVANGYLGSYRSLYYQLMLNNVNDLSIASVITQEGQSLGLTSTTINSFIGFTDVAHKGGSYGLSSGGPLWYDRAEFGWLSLPFIVNDVITPREYGFGAFVNTASNDTQASNAIYVDAIPELLRPTIHSALESWTNSLAAVNSYGFGCSGYAQSATGLPRLGATVNYNGTGGYGNGIVLFGLGFSNTQFGGLPLPLSLAPFGGEPGCSLLDDLQITAAAIANGAGGISFAVSIPSPLSGIGFTYYTQLHSFGPVTFRSTNGERSIVGF
jgi:hypothetical protein